MTTLHSNPSSSQKHTAPARHYDKTKRLSQQPWLFGSGRKVSEKEVQ